MNLGALPPGEALRRLSGPGLVLRTGPFQIRVTSSIPHFQRQFVDLYQNHALGDADQFIDFDIELKAVWSWSEPRGRAAKLLVSGDNTLVPLPIDQAMPLFEWGLNSCVISHAHQYIIVHAGVVARNDEAILLPGNSGSGKSTLTAALAHRGWRFFSDELALIEVNDRLVYPLPRPISLKNKSIDSLQRFAPEIHVGSLVEETFKGRVALLRPPAGSVAAEGRPARIAKILFPTFDATVAAHLTPLGLGQAFARLHDSTFSYGVRGKRDFAALADILERASSAEIRYGQFDAAIAQIEDPSLWPSPLIPA